MQVRCGSQVCLFTSKTSESVVLSEERETRGRKAKQNSKSVNFLERFFHVRRSKSILHITSSAFLHTMSFGTAKNSVQTLKMSPLNLLIKTTIQKNYILLMNKRRKGRGKHFPPQASDRKARGLILLLSFNLIQQHKQAGSQLEELAIKWLFKINHSRRIRTQNKMRKKWMYAFYLASQSGETGK